MIFSRVAIWKKPRCGWDWNSQLQFGSPAQQYAGWRAYNKPWLTHLNNNTTFKGSKVNTSHITEKTFDAYLRGNKIKNNRYELRYKGLINSLQWSVTLLLAPLMKSLGGSSESQIQDIFQDPFVL